MSHSYRVEFWIGARKYTDYVQAVSMGEAIRLIRARYPDAQGVVAYQE